MHPDGSDSATILSDIQAGNESAFSDRGLSAVFLPYAIELPDVEHLMFGGFEKIVTEESEYKALESHLTVIAHYLGNLDLRTRMLETCPGFTAAQKVFIQNWSVGAQFNWKWQYLIRFLEPLLVVLQPCIDNFDANAVARGDESLSPLKMTLITEFKKALSIAILPGACHVLLMWARSLTTETRFWAGCDCHQYILDDTTQPMRQRWIEYNRASAGCVLKARRLLTAICGRITKMLNTLEATRSDKFEAYLSTCGGDLASRCIVFSDSLRSRLLARLRLKWQLFHEPPVIFIGAIGYLSKHCSKAQSKEFVRAGLKVRDDMLAANCPGKLHRVTHRLCTLRISMVDCVSNSTITLSTFANKLSPSPPHTTPPMLWWSNT